jgi:hypothetical protein
MKSIIILISIFIFSIFFNVFTLNLIGDYEDIISHLPNIAQKSFISGCNSGYTQNNHIEFCAKLGQKYLQDLNKFLDKNN